MPTLDSRIPSGPLAEKWTKRKNDMKLVNPANKRKYTIIVVGTGLAGASAASSFGELGYNVKNFCFQDTPRRAHSIAAQGGINAAKSYQNDGDSVWRLFYDTIKGGDFRAREANVYRLAEVSNNIIDQATAQGVPFAREYGGTLANRSFGGALVSRTFYARGQTGQQLLIGAYQSLMRQVELGKVTMFPRTEMLDLVVIDGRARGIVTRNLVTGKIESHLRRRGGAGDRRVRQPLLPVHQRQGLERHRRLAGPPQGRVLRQPELHPDPPHVHPARGRVPVEAHAHVRVAAQRRAHLGPQEAGRQAVPRPDSRGRARLLPRAQVPDLRQPGSARHLVPRRQAGLRRRPGRRPGRTGRVPGLLRLHQAARREGHRGALRQPLRHVQPHHRRGSLHRSDAHLPRGALHHGRPVGGLRPPVQPARPVRARRGQLLRSRRQPPGRLRAHAGARRRLLRHPLHHRRLPGPRRDRQGGHRPRRVQVDREGRRGPGEELPLHRREALGRLVPQEARRDHVGERRHGPLQGEPGEGAQGDPGAARAVLEGPEGAGLHRRLQPGAGEGRPRGRLPRARASCSPGTRCSATSPAAATSASSTRPRTARRSATTPSTPTRPPGSGPGRTSPGRSTRSPSSSRTSTSRPGATSETDARESGARRTPRTQAASLATTFPT